MAARLALLAFMAAAAVAAAATTSSVAVYCTPRDACWPTDAEWAKLNTTVHGRLLRVLPEAAPCYTNTGGSPTSAQCAAIMNNFTDAFWRIRQPAAMQAINMEAGPNGESCYNPLAECQQGDVPPFAVAATSPADIAAALAFAAAHKLRVVVKSTGHEFQGRSTAANALMIWMHTFSTGVVIHEQWAGGCANDYQGPAVTVSAGTVWGDVYGAVAPKYGVVGALCRTVCASGGYVFGGGHSYMAPTHGLAVDNVLQFQAVLANGTLVTASPCSHPDLFWALRGGGGGTFAIVTSTTHRLHPTPASGVTGWTLEVNLLRNATSVAILLEALLAATPGWLTPTDTGVIGAGYWYLNPAQLMATFVFNGTQAAAEKAAQSLNTLWPAHPLDFSVVTNQFFAAPSMNAWHDVTDSGDDMGGPATFGSRLVPVEACTDATRRAAVVSALTNISASTLLMGQMTTGGAVALADYNSTHTSVTPAFRKSAFNMLYEQTWNNNATFAEQQAAFQQVTAWTALLRAAIPDSGAYFSESDYNEPDWQQAFWGAANYARLQQIKAAYDPNGVFTCHHCVELP